MPVRGLFHPINHTMRPYYLRTLFFLTTACLTAQGLLAQASGGSGAEGESPYSSSTTDNPEGGSWMADNGLIIICLVIFVGLVLFVSLRGRTRT